MSTDTSSVDSLPSGYYGDFDLSSGVHENYGDFDTSGGMLPLCGCELAMVVYIDNTKQNQGRRFWRCPNWMKMNTCDMLIWDDLLDAATRPMVAVTYGISHAESREVVPKKKCDCDGVIEGMQGTYEMKIATWKKNLEAEKKKVGWLKWMLMASWVFFCVFYARK